MPVIEVLLRVPLKIAAGLASGEYERVGGVIRNSANKQIVAFLREGGKLQNNPDPASALTRFLFQSLLQSSKLANVGDVTQQVAALSKLVGSFGTIDGVLRAANIAATARSHHLLTLRLRSIQNMLTFSTRMGMLQLAMTSLGLILMLKHYADLEATLKKVFAEAMDVSLQSKLRIDSNSALEAAEVVMGAKDGYYKESMAAFLDYLLINARERILSDFHKVRYEREKRNHMEASQQLLAKAIHLDETRIRAFLEVGQDELAHNVASNRLEKYRKETQNLIGILLGKHHKRAIYFYKKVSDRDLQRYLLIEQWLRGEEDILWDIVLKQRNQYWDDAVKKTIDPDGGIILPGKPAPKPSTRHLDALEQAETAIENFQRFEGFALELKSIGRLGISLREWEALENTGNTVFVNDNNVDLAEHDDYVLLVERDYLDSVNRLSD